jgi:hypothetical protein
MNQLKITTEKGHIRITTNHLDLVNTIKPDDELFTVILQQKFPDEACFENPALMSKTPEYRCSRLEYLARSKLWNHHDHKKYDAFREQITAHYKSGFNCEPVDKKEIETTFDMFCDCEKLKTYPEIFKTEEFHWASYKYYDEFDEDEPMYWRDHTWLEKMWKTLLNKECYLNEDDFVEKMREKHPEEYKAWFNEFVFLAAEHKYEIMFDKILPPLIGDIACRNMWSQFYFIKNKDGCLTYAAGSSSGSGTREIHGFCGHAFAEMSNKGHQITTYIISLDKKLEASCAKFDTLKLYEHDLTGNYQIDRGVSQKILQPIELVS